jgi:Peptidase_C39 like family
MLRLGRNVLIGLVVMAAAPASGREACQERTLSLRYSPQASNNWCWAASGEMTMEWLGGEPNVACQCRQAEQVLGVAGCCAALGSCTPAADAPSRCDAPRWPAFVERPDSYAYEYKTTCDALPERQDDAQCEAGRPVIAALHSPGSPRGHTVVVKGFSSHGGRRVLVVDPKRLCPSDRDCEGELDEALWITYDEFVSGWDGLVHWVDFYGIRRK